jgi:nucleotide-binding universal stress UspA family protein
MIGLVGIDNDGFYAPAMHLAGRLAFEKAEWHLGHVESPFTPMGTPFSSGEEVAVELESARQDSVELMDKASDQACRYGIGARTHFMEGPTTASMMSLSDDLNADLVAIGSHRTGVLASVFLGSMGRALAIGSKHSLLIGRGKVKESGPVSAVFATDHSYYAMRALEHMIAMKPTGLKTITLLTAYDPSELEGTYFDELTEEALAEKKTLHQKLTALSELAVSKLRRAGYTAHYEMKPGNVHDAINRAMDEIKPDLLILGAQGHGFLDRLLVGSVALHHVVAEPHSLMIIRP